jgi:hypothetical protein
VGRCAPARGSTSSATDPDAIRVFERVCEQGDATLEEVVASSAGSGDPLTPERAEAAWGRLTEMAERLRQGYL